MMEKRLSSGGRPSLLDDNFATRGGNSQVNQGIPPSITHLPLDVLWPTTSAQSPRRLMDWGAMERESGVGILPQKALIWCLCGRSICILRIPRISTTVSHAVEHD